MHIFIFFLRKRQIFAHPPSKESLQIDVLKILLTTRRLSTTCRRLLSSSSFFFFLFLLLLLQDTKGYEQLDGPSSVDSTSFLEGGCCVIQRTSIKYEYISALLYTFRHRTLAIIVALSSQGRHTSSSSCGRCSRKEAGAGARITDSYLRQFREFHARSRIDFLLLPFFPLFPVRAANSLCSPTLRRDVKERRRRRRKKKEREKRKRRTHRFVVKVRGSRRTW